LNSKNQDPETILLNKLIEYRQDPPKWIKENVKIIHRSEGIIPFKLYDFQEKVINLILSNHFVITLKSRQVGMSTLMQGFCLWCAIHYSNYNILIISAGQRNATEFLKSLKTMYYAVEENSLKPKLTKDNAQTMVFENGSTITALPATSSSARGVSVNLLVIDEAAYIPNIESVYQAIYPTISRAFSNTKGKPYGIVVLSTPNGISGLGGWYYKMYMSALSKKTKYIPVRVHWTEVPEYDLKWFQDQCEQLNWNFRSIKTEYELSFVSSGNTYIPSNLLASMDSQEPILKSADGSLWVWEKPDPDISYVMGVDVAYGTNNDYSTIQIINPYTMNQVAEYCNNKITIDDFAKEILNLNNIYPSLINIERNAVGKVLIERIIEKSSGLGVNLYRDGKTNTLANNKSGPSSTIGTQVTGQSRDLILSNMYGIIIDQYLDIYNRVNTNNDTLSIEEKLDLLIENTTSKTLKKEVKEEKKTVGIIKSERLICQLLGFVCDEHGRAEGDTDDLVMAYAHSLYAYSKSKKYLLTNVEKINKDFDENANTPKKSLAKFLFGGEKMRKGVFSKLSLDEFEDLLEDSEKYELSNKEPDLSSVASVYKIFELF